MHVSDEELQFLRICAILHDVGKPACWAQKQVASEHIRRTYETLKQTIGENYGFSAMRHHSDSGYSLEVQPKTELEKIIMISNKLASDAHDQEVNSQGLSVFSLPVHLTHVLSSGTVLYTFDAQSLLSSVQELKLKLASCRAQIERNSESGYLAIYEVLEASAFSKIPADPRTPFNDISLWEHLKLTAAFANCIWVDGGYKGDDLEQYEFCLVGCDADRISRFVKSSVRLADLNSRSVLIQDATREAGACVKRMLGPECLIFAGGGSIVALSPVKKAEEVCHQVKRSFEETTNGLVTITTSVLPFSAKRVPEDFGKVWLEAQNEMRLKKLERVSCAVQTLSEETAVCDVCHIRPAPHHKSKKVLPYDASPRLEQLCDSCWGLREQGKKVSLDDLCDPNDLVGLIRADGDSVGQILGGRKLGKLGKAATPSRLSAISRTINEVCEKSLRQKIVEANGDCLISGGDDILALVPGEKALGVALEISSEFKAKMAEECTMSAGVAIFKHDMPIYVGLEVSEQLLKEAKKAPRKNSVAFAFIGGLGLTPGEVLKAIHGPREWSKLSEILNLAKTMGEGDFVSGQIRKIAQVTLKNSFTG